MRAYLFNLKFNQTHELRVLHWMLLRVASLLYFARKLSYEERYFFIMRLATLISLKVHCVILLMLASAWVFRYLFEFESQ